MTYTSTATQHTLNQLLADFPQLTGAVLATADGLLLDALLPERIDPDALAAVLAGWVASFAAMGRPVPTTGCTLHIATGQMVVLWTPDGLILGALAEHNAPTGELLTAILDGRLRAALN